MFSVSCTGLTKQFRVQKPIRDFSFVFKAGQITSIVGESGCGKTTLLRLIAGLERPDAGTISYVEETGLPVSRRPVISTVFQEPRLFPWLTARENIALAVRDKSPAERQRLVNETLRTVGLASAADKYPHELSGGMAQRVGMARALCRKPDILLLDEAFSALDALTREKLRAEFVAIASSRPITTILVTHDVPEAVLLSQTICKLSNGSVNRVWSVAAPYPRTISLPGLAELADEILKSFFELNSQNP